MNFDYFVEQSAGAGQRGTARSGPYPSFDEAAGEARRRSEASAHRFRVVRRDLNAADDACEQIIALARGARLVEAEEGKPLVEDDDGHLPEPASPPQPASS